jgi:hypothetical protein
MRNSLASAIHGVDVNSFLVCLHRVDVSGVADVSEVHVASICSVEVSTHTATHFNPKDKSSIFLQTKL